MKPIITKQIASFFCDSQELDLGEDDACIHTETQTRSWMIDGKPVTVSCIRIAVVGAPLPQSSEEIGLIADEVGAAAGELLTDNLFEWQDRGDTITRDIGLDSPPSNN